MTREHTCIFKGVKKAQGTPQSTPNNVCAEQPGSSITNVHKHGLTRYHLLQSPCPAVHSHLPCSGTDSTARSHTAS